MGKAKVEVDLELLQKYINDLNQIPNNLKEFTFPEQKTSECQGDMAAEMAKTIKGLQDMRTEYIKMVNDTVTILTKYKNNLEKAENKSAINVKKN